MRRLLPWLFLALPLCAFHCGDYGTMPPPEYAATVGVAADPGSKLSQNLTIEELEGILTEFDKILTAHGFTPVGRPDHNFLGTKYNYGFNGLFGERFYTDRYHYSPLKETLYCNAQIDRQHVLVRFQCLSDPPIPEKDFVQAVTAARLIRDYLAKRFPDLKSKIEFTEGTPASPVPEKQVQSGSSK
jgi:hypothetical protein